MLHETSGFLFFMQEKYKGLHSRLPVVAAETLLCTDPQIELPLWLVDMFKACSLFPEIRFTVLFVSFVS
jgi:hypothetical protein